MTGLILKNNAWHLIEEVPEEPKTLNPVIQEVELRQKYEREYQKYEAALQQAISNAIVVDEYSQEYAKLIVGKSCPEIWLAEENKIYPVEVKYTIKDSWGPWHENTYPEKVAILHPKVEEQKLSVTEELKAMASKVELSDSVKEHAIHEAAKEAFKILFVHFHGLGLRSHIDVTLEQDGIQYQLTFKPISINNELNKISSQDLDPEIHKAVNDKFLSLVEDTPEQFYAAGNYPVMKDKFDMQRNQFDYYALMQFAYDYAEYRIASLQQRIKELEARLQGK